MANSPSARKRIRQNATCRQRNRSHRSRMRSAIKELRAAFAAGDAAKARELLPATLSLVDRTASKGAVHANAAARTKARLVKATAKLG